MPNPPRPDFQYPQMENPEPGGARLDAAPDRLHLRLVHERDRVLADDAMPLTRRAKLLMLLESAASIVTLLLVAARAVNILR